jgi:hypothetical protein
VKEEEAVAIARRHAEARGWTWLEPIAVQRRRRWFVGSPFWEVRTNSRCIGVSIFVRIDERTRAIYYASFFPR